jgi:chorismate--pyruvate lyase
LDVTAFPPGAIPEAISPWLVDHGSLTERLIALSEDTFQLTVLSQARQQPHALESAALGLAGGEKALVREVCLHGKGSPWVYARSTIPERTLSERKDLAGRLDNQPLGHWIFSATDLIRYPMQAHRLAPGTAWVPAELRGNIPLWARRSIFELGRYPLLICEVFLPDFPAYESI